MSRFSGRFLGRHLALQLLGSQPHDVLVLVRVELVALGVELLELDAAREHAVLPALVRGLAGVELGHDLPREQLEALDTEGFKLYSHQNEDIVRLTPEELKQKMAAKEAEERRA